MTTKSSFILKAVNIIFWIIFIGLCIKTGAIITSLFISLFFNPEAAKDLYLGLNLSEVFNSGTWYYISVVSFIVVLSALKAYITFLVVKIFLKFNFSSPFQTQITTLIYKISYVALGTGIVAITAHSYCNGLMKKGIVIPQDWGSGEILFFAGVIYILAEVFRKGTDLQTENELTV